MFHDSIEHVIFECFVIKNFWFEVIDVWNKLGNYNVRIDLKIMTFGYFCDDYDKYEHIALNSLLLIGKQYIFKQKVTNCTLSFVDFRGFLAKNVTRKDSDPAYHLLQRYCSTL